MEEDDKRKQRAIQFMRDDPFQLRDGIVALWETRKDDAQDFFSSNLTQPFCSLHYAEVAFQTALLTESSETEKDAMSRLAVAEALVKDKITVQSSWLFSYDTSISPHEKSLYSVALAEIYMMTAAIQLRRGEYLRGAYNIRRSWKAFEANNKDFSTSNDSAAAYPTIGLTPYQVEVYRRSSLNFGLGAFYFFVSLIPPSFLWLVEAIGFSANRQQGLKLLKECVKSGGHKTPAALLLLIWIQSFWFENGEKAEKYLALGTNFLPSCPLYRYLEGYMTRKTGSLEYGIQVFNMSMELSYQQRQLQLSCMYELGWCYFLQLDWEKALSYFVPFLDETRAPSFRAYCGYQAGVCYHLLGKYEEAKKVFALVPGWTRKHYSFDEFGKRKAEEYLEKGGWDKLETSLLILSVMDKAKDYQKVLTYISEVTQMTDDESEERAVILYFKGRVYRGLGDKEEAINCFLGVLDLEDFVKNEVYILPHSLTEVAELYFEEDRLDQAKELLLKAKKYSHYDFDKPLHRRISKSIDLIEQGKKTVSRIWGKPSGAIPRRSSAGQSTDQVDRPSKSKTKSRGKASKTKNKAASRKLYSKKSKEQSEDSGADSDKTTTEDSESSGDSEESKGTAEIWGESISEDELEASMDPELAAIIRQDKKLDYLVMWMLNPTDGLKPHTVSSFVINHENCIWESEMVAWICEKMMYTRQQALKVMRELIATSRMHVVYAAALEPEHPEALLRFQYHVPHDHVMNKAKIWKIVARPAALVVAGLNSMISTLYDRFLDDATGCLDLAGLKESKEFLEFSIATAELQKTDLSSLTNNQKLAFFLNLYNILVIHGTACVGVPTGGFSRNTFFSKVSYCIDDNIYSLDDIEHGILRGNSSSPGSLFGDTFNPNDPRIAHVFWKVDPRIHFCLNCGAKSCPRLQLYTDHGLDGQLTYAAQVFVEKNVMIVSRKREVKLSQIFKWYAKDFASTTRGVLQYIVPFLDNARQEEMKRLLSGPEVEVSYIDYDWSSMYK